MSRKTNERRGTTIGALAGLMCVHYLMTTGLDPHVTEHKAIFPFAVMLLCLFSIVIFLVLTLIGNVVGWLIPYTSTDSKVDREL